MITEADFQAALDAAPWDQVLRGAFADWLDEHEDPRAAGYRALSVLNLWPVKTYDGDGEPEWGWNNHLSPSSIRHAVIPWTINIHLPKTGFMLWPSRWQAEDVFAAAWCAASESDRIEAVVENAANKLSRRFVCD